LLKFIFLLLFPDRTSSLATSSVILLDKVAQELDKAAIIFSNKVIAACVVAINRRNKALKEFLFISQFKGNASSASKVSKQWLLDCLLYDFRVM
jgi:hypothetical protein